MSLLCYIEPMFKWIKQYRSSSAQTKYFILTWIVYAIAIIWTTVQAYARLEYSRTSLHPVPYVESSEKK
jgi:hypothetical protein